MEENKKPELQIVTPRDFKIDERHFECPKCASKAIALDPEFEKSNIANSIEDDNSKEKVVVLKCANCNHKDLLVSFVRPFSRNPEMIKPDPSEPWIYDPNHMRRAKRKIRPYTIMQSENDYTI